MDNGKEQKRKISYLTCIFNSINLIYFKLPTLGKLDGLSKISD